MSFPPQIKIPAMYMRGGTSKGVFFALSELPLYIHKPGVERDRFLLRVIGSPDPYGTHTDGMGGATSSTSKTVIVGKSAQVGHDVDYLFGQVSIDKALIDWSGNCGNLTAAVGAFAIHKGLVDKSRIPDAGFAEVRIWQANIHKTIIVQIPISNGVVQETGDFELDGVTFPAAEIKIAFIQPAAQDGSMFPTGNLIDELDVPGVGRLQATLIDAGVATIFLNADDINYTGTESQTEINRNLQALRMFEAIRNYGALKMGLIGCIKEAVNRQHTPKVAFVAPPKSYVTSSGKEIPAENIDLLVRALSMGRLHHAMMGTAAVAIGVAAAVPGTLVNLAAGGGTHNTVTLGHPSGILRVAAEVQHVNDGYWIANKVIMSRSARRLMEGHLYVPDDVLQQ